MPPSDAEFRIHRNMCLALIPTFTFVFFQHVLGFARAPYGRYASDWSGYRVNGRLDWLGHGASLAVLVPLWRQAKEDCRASFINKWFLFGMFGAHYVNRSLIFGLRIKDPKPITVSVLGMTAGFCALNGYLQGLTLTAIHAYPASWLKTPQFLIGSLLFYSGMLINITSDNALAQLRKPGEKGYKIPQGGLFEYVSCANFLGEIVEWAGFALATCSLSGFTFAFTTFANVAPRALHHHKWYLEQFGDAYPKRRRALIPFLL